MKQYKVSSNRACDGQRVENITCSIEIAHQLAESAKEAGHTNIKIEEVEEEQTMKNTKKYNFEIRQLDCWMYDGEWTQNTSYHMGEMQTKSKDERKAFTAWIKRHLGISFKPNRTLIEFDGDCYTIIDRKTK